MEEKKKKKKNGTKRLFSVTFFHFHSTSLTGLLECDRRIVFPVPFQTLTMGSRWIQEIIFRYPKDLAKVSSIK